MPVGRAAVLTVTAFATLGRTTCALPPAFRLIAAGTLGAISGGRPPWGLAARHPAPGGVVDSVEVYASVFFRLLASGRHLRTLTGRNRRYELARAVAVLPWLPWDAADLVPLAAGYEEAREHTRAMAGAPSGTSGKSLGSLPWAGGSGFGCQETARVHYLGNLRLEDAL
ncbi:hypothetical protein ACIHCV_33235 [Streptomyces sp. NPDC051956]|uniref:hypothetical protein n=1 Tax=Streptomyces sp. NPDC051956 TaxID=3365677 RepID=UPI0037D12443